MTKYDNVINWFKNNLFFTILFIAIAVMILLPQIKQGILVIKSMFSKNKSNKYRNLKNAAKDIRSLLEENRRVFISVGPNSSAGNINELHEDMELWKIQRDKILLANNSSIKSILNKIEKPFTIYEKSVCDSMLIHIDAYDAYCSNKDAEYSDKFRFPVQFSNLIDEYCAEKSAKKTKKKIRIVSSWITKEFHNNKLVIQEQYFFGSLVCGVIDSDIDILLLSGAEDIEKIENISYALKELENKFKKIFIQSLHIQCYSKFEIDLYDRFKMNCGNLLKF